MANATKYQTAVTNLDYIMDQIAVNLDDLKEAKYATMDQIRMLRKITNTLELCDVLTEKLADDILKR